MRLLVLIGQSGEQRLRLLGRQHWSLGLLINLVFDLLLSEHFRRGFRLERGHGFEALEVKL